MSQTTRLYLRDQSAFDARVPYRVLLNNLTFDLTMLATARHHCESDAVTGHWALEFDCLLVLVTICFRFEHAVEAQAFLTAIPGSYRVAGHPDIPAEFQTIFDAVCNSTHPDDTLRREENTRKLLAFGLATGRGDGTLPPSPQSPPPPSYPVGDVYASTPSNR